MSGVGSIIVTPELALVDPELAKAQRQIPERKAAMSSTPPSNGAFFIDPAQPVPPPVGPEPALTPPAEPAPLAAPVAAQAPLAAPEPVAAPEPMAAAEPVAAAAPASALIDSGDISMRDVPLGTLVFRAGLLAEEQLEDALQEGMRTGKRLGEVLLERGWLHERDLGRLLAGQKGLPFVEVNASDAEPSALQLLPEEKARLQTALPLRQEEGQLVVAVADPSNELVLENLRRTFGYEPRLVVAPHGDLIRAIEEAYTGVAAPMPSAQPEPALVQPAPQAEVQPAPQVEVPLAPPVEAPLAPPVEVALAPPVEVALALQPEPKPEPAPIPSLQEEPVQPLTPPAVVTPMPTVVPPAEDRQEPAALAPLQPLVVEPVEHTLEQPASIAPTSPPVEETPALQPPVQLEEPVLQAPVEETPVLQPAPELEQPLLQPEPVPTPAPEAPAQPQVIEIVEPLAPEAPLQPLVPPAAEQPMDTVMAPPAPLVQAPETQNAEEPAPMHVVVLRLQDGEILEVGAFQTAAEASARAQEVVAQIAAAEGEATWPFFAQRYLRPDSICSVELLEESADKWLGSAVRTRWANQA